jgi:hypothetical protein
MSRSPAVQVRLNTAIVANEVVVEGEDLLEVVYPDPSIELVERSGQPAQILVVPTTRLNIVRRLERSTLGDGGEGTDADVVDPVAVEHAEDSSGERSGRFTSS